MPVDIETDGLDFQSGTNTIDNDGNESTDWTGNKDYQTVRTPFLQSQLVNGIDINFSEFILVHMVLI